MVSSELKAGATCVRFAELKLRATLVQQFVARVFSAAAGSLRTAT